jgi:hypothetical protein
MRGISEPIAQIDLAPALGAASRIAIALADTR